MKVYKIPCTRCNGFGRIPHFKHVEDGICFECGGSGVIDVDAETFKDYEHKLQIEREGKFVVFNRGKVEYYQTKEEIHEKYGRFKSGEYGGWAVLQSYKDEHVVYVNHCKRTPEFVFDCQIEYAHSMAIFVNENDLVDYI